MHIGSYIAIELQRFCPRFISNATAPNPRLLCFGVRVNMEFMLDVGAALERSTFAHNSINIRSNRTACVFPPGVLEKWPTTLFRFVCCWHAILKNIFYSNLIKFNA